MSITCVLDLQENKEAGWSGKTLFLAMTWPKPLLLAPP